MTTRVGQVLEQKYKLIRLIGEGGMGEVYEAEHTVLGRRVAIKFLHPDLAGNEQLLQRFFQEAKIAGNLGHPNICEVTDVGTADDGAPYMIMPYLEGRSLREVLDEGMLALPRVVDIMAQVLSGLAKAHDAGIVHRDLKPANIFLTRVGDRTDFVKLLDFGISKVVRQGEVGSGLTVTGTIMGTPYYMAPEQARGQRDLDGRADIYSAGVVLFEMLTGRVPFVGENYNEIIIKIVTEEPPPVTTISNAVPLELEEVVSKAMAAEREERFQSAREFRAALLAAARRVGVLGVPPGGEEWSDAYSLPGRPSVALSQSLLTESESTRPNELGSTVETVLGIPRRRKGWLVAVVALLLAAGGLVAGLLLWHPWKSRPQAGSPSGPAESVAQVSTGSDAGGSPGKAERPDAGMAAGRQPARHPKTVRLTVVVRPREAKATIRVGGRTVRGNTVVLPWGKDAIPIVVRAPGYEEVRTEIRPTADITQEVQLTAVRRTRRGRRGRGGRRARGVIHGRNKTSVVTQYGE